MSITPGAPYSATALSENVLLKPPSMPLDIDCADFPTPSAARSRSRIKKVLVANKFFFRNGGSEAVMFDEIDWLRDRGLDVIEFSMRDSRNRPSAYSSYFVTEKDYKTQSRVDKMKAALSFIRSREAVDSIGNLIRDQKPSLVHCHNIYHQLTPSIINMAARLKTPVVLTLHDYKTVCPVYTQISNGEICTSCADGRVESVLAKRCADGSLGHSMLLWAEARYHVAARSYQRVSKFVAPSRFMQDAVARRFGEDKVVHIPNGIDASRIELSTLDDGYVLYLGRLSREKGVATLLKAHAADGASWPLVIAGTGPMLTELQTQFPAAEFRGHLSGPDLESTIRRAAVIVVPSEWNENSPLSILEAMANGKPVLASRIGGIPELVRDGVTGFLFAPKSVEDLLKHLRPLLADAEMRARLGAEARRIVEKEHSLERHGATLLALYQSLTIPKLMPQHRVGF